MTGVREPWHLDKRVPLALIFTILGQTALAGWFAASLATRVETLERDVERQRLVDTQQDISIRRAEQHDVVQNQKLENILDIVERMDRRLERYIEQD
ncbi:MAG: hypothetical protein ACPG4X_15795 [Pikeienuella sp.]